MADDGTRDKGKAFGEPEGRRTREKPGNTPVEQQERPAADVDATKHSRVAITGPGASDFLTASGGVDRPGAGGTKGTAQTRDEGPLADTKRLSPRLGPDTEAFPGERRPDEQMTGSQTGTIGGGGLDAHNPSPERASGVDDSSVQDAERKTGE